MVEGSYFLWEWGGMAVSSIPTSTLHPRLPILLPHTLSLVSSLTHHDFGSVGSSRTRIGWFWSQADISLVPRVAEHPRTVIRVLAVVLFIHRQNRSCVLLTQGLYC